MKRFLCFVLCALMLFGMAACGGDTPATTNPAPDPTDNTTAPIVTVITTDAESYTVTVGAMVPIVAAADPEMALTYTSGNEAIATVNKYGKVVGVKAGTTEVTITAADGTTKVVPITVEGPKYANVLRVCLNVLYNDTERAASTQSTAPMWKFTRTAPTPLPSTAPCTCPKAAGTWALPTFPI